jgi:hypothetical protein
LRIDRFKVSTGIHQIDREVSNRLNLVHDRTLWRWKQYITVFFSQPFTLARDVMRPGKPAEKRCTQLPGHPSDKSSLFPITFPLIQPGCKSRRDSSYLHETRKSNSGIRGYGITKMSWYSTKLTIDSWHSEKIFRSPQRYKRHVLRFVKTACGT